MILIEDQRSNDASFNLALEEYCLLNLPIDESYLLFYVNAPSIIIGKHQNTVEEIDTDFVKERNIRVVRRISGGGAVYHDLGNLNFSFIRRFQREHFNNYGEFTGPVVAALKELGVPAELTGRNDILVDGRKVSGNAQARRQDRMFSHGTLLFRSNLDDVVHALKPKPGKLASKGIQSIRSRVVNIGDYLPESMDLDAFKAAIITHLFPGEGGPQAYKLSEAQLAEVRALADSKYRTWEWNYGASPDFNLQRVQRFPIGEVDARLMVEKGLVRSAKIYGDFFSDREIGDLEKALTGIRYEQEELRKAITDSQAEEILEGVSADDWVKLLY